MVDSLLHQGKRRQLIKSLSSKYPFPDSILEALYRVPRHLFLEKGLDNLAYLDKPLPIGCKQTISQPFTVAMQTHLLCEVVGKFQKVLEIGTGCGYQSAVLAQMGLRVYTIERQRELSLLAQKNLTKLDYHTILTHYGDGFEGMPKFAPFKGILVTCGAPEIPEKLLLQLEVGGRMVIPCGVESQTMITVDRISEKEYVKSEHGQYSFVPMLKGVE